MVTFSATVALILCLSASSASASWIVVEKNGHGFVMAGDRFVPWGFKYSRDEKYRLIEDYWDTEGPEGWSKVERDFREMKHLGANVIRVQLQFAKFMVAP